MSNVHEALKQAIEALETASEDAKEWAMQYVTSDNAPISVRQYVADKTEPALTELKAALADIAKCEPVAEALHERNRLGYAVVDVIGALDEIIENAQEVEVDDFLHIAIPIDKWHELQDALEEMPKRAELYTSPQPIEKCEPVALVALNNAALQKRVEVLEDLLTSAASIASRNGEGTHWERFIGQLKVNGIGNITAKTFRVLPSDEGYTSPQPREWVYLSDIDKAECASHVSKLGVLGAVNATEAKLKQLNTKG